MSEHIHEIDSLILDKSASSKTVAFIHKYGAHLEQGKSEISFGDLALNRLEKAFVQESHDPDAYMIVYHYEDPKEAQYQDTRVYFHPTGVSIVSKDSHYGISIMNLNSTEIETLLNGWKKVRYFWKEFPLPAGHALLNCGHIVPWHGEQEAMECPIDRKRSHIYRINTELAERKVISTSE